MPGLGEFLYRPMAAGVAFAMISAYLLSRTFVPVRSARWLSAHLPHGLADQPEKQTGHDSQIDLFGEAPAAGHRPSARRALFRQAFARWEAAIDSAIGWYVRQLDRALRHRFLVVFSAIGLFAVVLTVLSPRLRREFFPEVDSGAFEIYARAPSGTRIEETEKLTAKVEQFVREQVGGDLQLIISELGVVADLSAAYTPNAGPMDAVVKVQLKHEREHSAQEHVHRLRAGLNGDQKFRELEFAFDAGGMIRSAMNEGKSSPINIRLSGKNMPQARSIAETIKRELNGIDGVVDARIIQRLDYPEYIIEVNRAKVADLGLNQAEVMKNVVSALNSSIQFHKKNFWIDPVSKNQYFVGVQYFENEIDSVDTLLDVPITSTNQDKAIPLRNIAEIRRSFVPTEITHNNLQSTIDLTMGVYGRDLGHVAADVAVLLDSFGAVQKSGVWLPYDPADHSAKRAVLQGASLELSGEYSRMQETFRSLGLGLILATMLIYFLMAALFKSYLTPLVILFAVPLGLVGVVTMLYLTSTAINVQSLLGVIFMVGIVVSNTVLLVDFAQHLRQDERLTPHQAIRKAASIRARPVVMTALAAFFALVPMALALGRGSEANAPWAAPSSAESSRAC